MVARWLLRCFACLQGGFCVVVAKVYCYVVAKVFWMAARTLLRCSGWLLVMFNCFGCLLGRY